MPKKLDITKKPASKTTPATPEKKERYFEAIGARKTAAARVRLFTKGNSIFINEKDYKQYFKTPKHQQIVTAPLALMGQLGTMKATIKVRGGGSNAQAEAVRHGIARALIIFNNEFKGRLRAAGFMTRDARHVERKKYGLKKARRAPQWAKR